MDLRSFLQPTRSKIALAVLIYLLFVPIIQYCVYCFMAPCPGCQYVSLAETLFFNRHPFNHPNWLFALAGLPASYLASCFLLFLLSKHHKKK